MRKMIKKVSPAAFGHLMLPGENGGHRVVHNFKREAGISCSTIAARLLAKGKAMCRMAGNPRWHRPLLGFALARMV
jgi:hypothetical protein